MDTFKYFVLLNINEEDYLFKLDIVRGYCDNRCFLCKKCLNPDIIRIIQPEYADFYERYIINHQVTVTRLCESVAFRLNLPYEDKILLIQSALLHDIGKFSISEKSLLQKRKLTSTEFKEIKNHAILGASYLKGRGFSDDIVETVKFHHERYDGRGYPNGLKGKKVPYLSRILSICDSFDAMISGRHYKEALPPDDAIKELEKNSGSQFDPDIASQFIILLKEKEASKVV